MKKLYVFLLLSFIGTSSLKAQYSVITAFPFLPTFSRPLELVNPDDGTNRLFVVEQRGPIYVIANNPNTTTRKMFLNLTPDVSQSGNETGLLGLAFHPNYKSNGTFYVCYTNSVGSQLKSYVARYTVSSNPDSADKSTGEVILTLDQPYANHNGGKILFGPDGFLYISFGDGGSGGDPQGNGQNKKVLLGKILRINVNAEANGNKYAIPPTNPFFGNTAGNKEEIFAYGVRNIWKMSFDAQNRLWAGDVGQDKWEEVDIITNGGNYGWRTMEGFHCYNPSSGCDSTGLISPLWEYSHTPGDLSITGGYVYRGSATKGLTDKYVYADYSSGKIWALTYTGAGPSVNTLIIDKVTPAINIPTFGEDQNHELFFTTFNGRIMKIVDSTSHPLVAAMAPGTTLCLGDTITIPYVVNPTNNPSFSANNIFTAQLSDSTGSFTVPVTLGTKQGTGSGSIAVILPSNTPPGNNYRIRVNASAPATSGWYSTSGFRIVRPPATPTITRPASDSLQSSPAATYQWYRNGTAVGGATGGGFKINPNDSAVYVVVVYNAQGCKASSQPFLVLGSSGVRADQMNSGNLRIFPNPASQNVHIELPNERNAVISICDELGRTLRTERLHSETEIKTQLDLHGIPSGQYFFFVTLPNGVVYGRVVGVR